MAVPNISSRKYIRWPPAPASEPTSTLVLTSQTAYFVDLRIDTLAWIDGFSSSVLLSSPSPAGHLAWAIAGTSTTTPATTTRPAHTVWSHMLDSLSDAPRPDEGDMFPQPNGDVLERGRMQHPDSGLESDYEELWTDLEVQPAGDQDEGACWSVVWKARDWGLIVRVGTWCQGFVKRDGTVTVERWRWCARGAGGEQEHLLAAWTAANEQNTEEKGDGAWVRIVRLGEATIPCKKTWEKGHQDEDADWKLQEHHRF